mmetsp:Transcript_19273/g.53835  ORF Transcript_19273/g.53835 Transcript_19273/m.53835 type:complete len:808 (-) Transcript_19273:397-2820(-)
MKHGAPRRILLAVHSRPHGNCHRPAADRRAMVKVFLLVLLASVLPRARAIGSTDEARRAQEALSSGKLRGFGSALAQLASQDLLRPERTAKESQDGGSTGEPAKPREFNIAGWTLHHIGGTFVFVVFCLFVCWPLPIIKQEWDQYNEFIAGGKDTFRDYLKYRFTDWFTTNEGAPSLMLIFLTMTLIVFGAIIYSALVGESPSHALWRIFVWASGSPAEKEVTPAGRFLGILVTVCGMIILSLLFGIVTEVFAAKMKESKHGLQKVVEGGHVVLLGFTDCTRCLIEELATARESAGGGTFVILAREMKEEVEKVLFSKALALKNSRLIIRSGYACRIRDLDNVAVQSASEVVLLSDSKLAEEEADAQLIRVILALKGKGWPSKGRVVVQCANPVNKHLFKGLYDAEVVVVGKIVAKLMAQSSQQSGFASVFSMMLGFEGDEFYSKEWPELVGLTFHEVVFRFPAAVCLGIFTAEGKCILNPGWGYRMQEGDSLIVLAEDDDAYEPTDKPYWEPACAYDSAKSDNSALEREPKPSKVLIIGWNPNIGPLLSNLDDMVGFDSEVNIYSAEQVGYRESTIAELQHNQRDGQGYAALKIVHRDVEIEHYSSNVELTRLKHQEFDKIFILAELNREAKRDNRDEKTVAVLSQLQMIHCGLPENEKTRRFDPVVEMCEDSTKEHLQMCGFANLVHSSSLVSQAIAAVIEESKVNAIYGDLMSGREQSFDIRAFAQYLPQDEALPKELSFAEAAYRIALAGDISLLAWSVVDEEGAIAWEMNPADKVTPRPWTKEDRVVVVRRFCAIGDDMSDC